MTFIRKDGLDVGKYTTLSDGNSTKKFVQLLVVPDGQLQVTGDDSGLLNCCLGQRCQPREGVLPYICMLYWYVPRDRSGIGYVLVWYRDQQLLTKLSCGGDLVALEAKYHATCLAKLYRKAQTSSYDDNGEEKIVRPEGIALAELVAYIEESTLTIFKLADLAKAYKSRSEHDRLDINRIAMVDAFQEETSNSNLIHPPYLLYYLFSLIDQAKSVAMIRHAMNVIKECVHHLNPGQVPVIAMDQPLYTVAKQIQWNWPDQYGEQKFVIMFGGLHIEMAFLKAIGGWLEDSGWVAAIVDANVASSGTAESFIKATSVTRSRRTHQVTASSLYILLNKAYSMYIEGVDDDALLFDDWCHKQALAVPQFQYWYTTLQLELLLLTFLRSLRQANFTLYIEALSKMMPWFFALNHTNYARWLPVHLRDMYSLKQAAPEVASHFEKGFFTVHKSPRSFSAIAIDHAHEQNNAIVKGDGGAVGLTENPVALRRWMTSGPEMARLVNEFESSMLMTSNHQSSESHHEVQTSFQVSFFKDVTSLVATFEDLGNPFIEESEDLLVLDTKEIAAPDAVGRLRQIETIGRDQFDTFLTERLLDRKKSLYDPIKRNKLSLFASPPSRKTSKTAHQLTSMKRDCSLFARLYISCQTREGDLDDFFKHENQGCPPSLSNFGKLRLPKNKSQLTECLEADSTVRSEMPNSIDVTIIDGAVLVHMIKPGTEKTFSEYASQSFLPYIQAQSRHVDRLDVVWDEYVENSLKATTRGNRGAGVRRRVAGTNRLPSNWKEFLRVDENKRELFKFLAECISNLDVQKQIITTYGDQVLCTLPRDTSSLAPCSHEEADTRMMLHVQDAVQHGYEKIMLRTVDTDVLILAVAVLSQLSEHARPELWLAFGTGNHLRYIAAHEISSSLGPQTSKALPVFHAFTGCDTVSCFGGRGKNTALEVWKLRAALVEHTKRAAYQAGYCWGQALKPRPVLPSPEKWGWTLSEGTWEPFWSALPDVTKSCRQLVECGCKKGCRGRCSCAKVELTCTALCSCAEECGNR
ncbi:hypothetical protein QZH41_011790 [Actinostola sp. cb2023]|nr:hypothetical protein QZH41_011790 [Actinostola sp. cb2023]